MSCARLPQGQHYIFHLLLIDSYDQHEVLPKRMALPANDDPLAPHSFFVLLRAAQALIVSGTVVALRRNPTRRTSVQTTAFVCNWICHLLVNMRLLYLSASNPVSQMMYTGLIAMCISLALCFHVASPKWSN